MCWNIGRAIPCRSGGVKEEQFSEQVGWWIAGQSIRRSCDVAVAGTTNRELSFVSAAHPDEQTRRRIFIHGAKIDGLSRTD